MTHQNLRLGKCWKLFCFRGGAPLAVQVDVKAPAVQTKNKNVLEQMQAFHSYPVDLFSQPLTTNG